MKHFLMTAAALCLAAPVAAAELATGDEIRAAVSGNTVQGDMSDGTAYTEFYDSDGTIRGADYTAEWTIEGDEMCFDYGEGPGCWGVMIDGDQVTWMSEGEEEGTGTLMMGNPNDF